MSRKVTAAILLAALPLVGMAILTPTSAKADGIEIYNTGIDTDPAHTQLPNDFSDRHYILVTSADPLWPAPQVGYTATAFNGYPIPPWLGDDPISDWISPSTGARTVADGDYDYQTKFDLTGFDLSEVGLTGQWASDDAGVDILINGVSTGQTITAGSTPGTYSYDHWTPFSISSGFMDGINTVDFIINNNGGSAGLRVEFDGATNPSTAVPEPSQAAALGVGVAGLGVLALRKRRRSIG